MPVRLDLLAWVGEQDARLSRAVTQGLGLRGQRLRDLARALPKPAVLVENATQRLDRAADRLPLGLRSVTQRKRLRLSEVSSTIRPDAIQRLTRDARRQYADRAARLRPDLLQRDMDRRRTALDAMNARFAAVSRAQLDAWSNKIDALDRMRQTLGYTETLRRGYAVVRGDDKVITTQADAAKAAALEIEFSDGRLAVGAGAKPASAKKVKPIKPDGTDQGSLF